MRRSIHYYSHAKEAGEKGFTVGARGDLDCDGTLSALEMAKATE